VKLSALLPLCPTLLHLKRLPTLARRGAALRWLRPAALAASAGLLALPLSATADEAYPSKPIRMVMCCVGAIDSVARVVADVMSQDLGQPVVVDARPGAAGGIGADIVAKSKGDGYTIFVGTNATHAANQSLYKNLPYDYVRDFTPIGGIGSGQVVLLVNPNSPIKSVADLTARARSEPGKLSYAWASSSTRIAMELYSQLAQIKLTDVPYKTNPQATTDLIGGQFDALFADLNTSGPLVKAGKLRALAVSGDRRSAVLPDVPTMKEAGVAGYSLTWWVAVWAPAGTPRPVVDRLNTSLTAAIKSAKVGEYFKTSGSEPMPMSADDLMKFQVSEHAKWSQIVTRAGIKPQ
jgi:tripartite-type tricarboxylate transporter receptor subunit TctC